MLVVGLFSRWSASRRRARVLSSAGYLLGMGEVPLFFWLFPIYACGTKPSTYQFKAYCAVFGFLVEFFWHVPDFPILLVGTKPGAVQKEHTTQQQQT